MVDRRQPVAVFQHDVGEHDVEVSRSNEFVSPGKTFAGCDVIALFPQGLADNCRNSTVVFDQ